MSTIKKSLKSRRVGPARETKRKRVTEAAAKRKAVTKGKKKQGKKR